jgi:CRISPR/Cas system-associated endoribonuclease Cas2
MKKNFLALLCLLLFSIPPTFAQDNMAKLLQERDKLYEAYEHYENQNSSLFGKKSKKDLLNIINTLKEIIQKDSEIIREVRLRGSQVRMQSTQKESSYIAQNHQTAQLISNLNNDVEKLTAQVKLKNSELLTQREYYAVLENDFTLYKIITGILAVTVIGLAIYVRRLKASQHKQQTIN